MLLGIALHSALAYVGEGSGWPVSDSEASPFLLHMVSFVHGFRMPLFFVLSGFFTAMLWQRRGLGGLLKHRSKRILVPLAVGSLTIVPAVWALIVAAGTDGAAFGAPSSDQNLWSAAAAGDVEEVERFVTNGWALDEIDPLFRQTPLAWAVHHNHPDVVAYLIEAGADPDSGSGRGLDTALHAAAFFGRFECADLLLRGGADVNACNRIGETPMDALRTSQDQMQGIASMLGVKIDFGEVARERERVQAVFEEYGAVSGGTACGVPGPADGGDSPRAVSNRDVAGAVLMGLMHFPALHHLWFLWVLCWLIAGFALASSVLQPILRRVRFPSWLTGSPLALLWLVPLTATAQSRMFAGNVVPAFGPDTSAGLLPIPHVLAYFAIFFGFGAIAYLMPARGAGPVHGWWAQLLLALALYPVAFAIAAMTPWAYRIAGDEATRRTLSALGQALFCWLMIFGCLGLCRRVLSEQRRWVRYLSDSSYWLYLVHLPLVIVGQQLLQPLAVPALAKFAILVAGATGVLLASYEWGVRYTFVGTALNGPRRRPTR